MAGTLRDDLASLKIDRRGDRATGLTEPRGRTRPDGGGRLALAADLADPARPARVRPDTTPTASTTRSGPSPRSPSAWCRR